MTENWDSIARVLEPTILACKMTSARKTRTKQKNYRPARLVVPAPNSKDQRRHIKFHCYDERKKKVCRQRMYTFRGQPIHESASYLDSLIKGINLLLSQGYVIGDNSIELEVIRRSEMTIKDVMEVCLDQKKRFKPNTYKAYERHVKYYLDWLKKHHPYIDKEDIDGIVVEKFLQYLQLERKNSVRSVNNTIISLKAIYNVGLKNGYVKRNPFTGVGTTRFEIGRNVAFNKDQQKEIIAYAERYPEMQFAIRFMYYTLCRSSEMSRIQIKDLYARHPEKLYLPADKTKVARERHPILHPKLRDYIAEKKLKDLPEDYYLFGFDFKPAEKPWKPYELGKRFRRKVLNPLGYSKDYTFTSWKHTGAVTMHNNGVPDYKIMVQAGWSTYKAFQQYLKSLGLEDNTEVVELIDEI